jgi:hypothetical protein
MSRKHKETAEVPRVNQEKNAVPIPSSVSVSDSLDELKDLFAKAFEHEHSKKILLEAIEKLTGQIDECNKQHEEDQAIINILLNTLEYEPKLTRFRTWLKK